LIARKQLTGDSDAVARRKTLEVLERVALHTRFGERYPRELSGGQRQRAAIARALVVEPDLMICDEITSALDVSVQAVIVELLAQLQRESGLTILFVTHNLPLVCNMAQRVIVLRSGHIVENGTVREILQNPKSEETRRLMTDAPDFTH
jgi:peptide/nickel transport system ATP-binding protein